MTVEAECLWLDGFLSALSTVSCSRKYIAGAIFCELDCSDLVGSLSTCLGAGELELGDNLVRFDEGRLVENASEWLDGTLREFLTGLLRSALRSGCNADLIEHVIWKVVEGVYRVCDRVDSCFVVKSLGEEDDCKYVVIPARDKYLVLILSVQR